MSFALAFADIHARALTFSVRERGDQEERGGGEYRAGPNFLPLPNSFLQLCQVPLEDEAGRGEPPG